MVGQRKKLVVNKIAIFVVSTSLISLILIVRLFDLQILKHNYYEKIATSEQYGYTELPAQRGDIIIKDYHSGEEFSIGTNTTLNLLYADPTIITDAAYVRDQIAPLIFDLKEEREKDNARIEEAAKKMPPDITEEDKEKLLKPLTDQELEDKFKQDLLAEISEKQRQKILLVENLPNSNIEKINIMKLNGIEVDGNNVYAYPPQITNRDLLAQKLSQYVEIPTQKLTQILVGKNRYVVLKRKLDPEISRKIEKMVKEDKEDKLAGISMKEEYFRYYPENTLAANVIGYVNDANVGQYGIESSFNADLQGVAGKFQTKKDSLGRQITVGESILSKAVNGAKIVLTIDRSIQLETERILGKAVKEYQADSGQIIVMDPKTGKVLAMANYPTFDPNNYGDVFKKTEVTFTDDELKSLVPSKEENMYYFYKNPITLDRYPVFTEKDKEGKMHYYRYENFVGPEVYHNKPVSWPYEPGSVFKPIVMAMALDDGDVTPKTTYNDAGPVGVDWNIYKNDYDFFIKNSTGFHGLVDMTTVISKSLNTGMTFVAKKIGKALMYSYLDKFGFLDRTDIEFDTESIGQIEYFEDWTESELATHAFGQGITVTMIQLANAYSTLVNGGVLMQPYIVDEIRYGDGTVSTTEPKEIRRVISEDTSSKVRAMLINSAETGEAKKGQVIGHYVGGKTGTSQTYKHGEPLSGPGTTLASFAGYGPADDPKFVISIKLDRPKANEWGSSTSAIAFSELATYLFDYYNIPPDKK